MWLRACASWWRAGDAQSEDEEEEDVNSLVCLECAAHGSGSRFPQKEAKLAADEDEEEEEEEDDDDAKSAQKLNQNGEGSKPSTPRSKGQESFKKQEKTPKTLKGPNSVEDIKAKMQTSIEKGGSLPKVKVHQLVASHKATQSGHKFELRKKPPWDNNSHYNSVEPIA
ncbi:hypothetical protein GH733_006931, partial [Mirounga leonina]